MKVKIKHNNNINQEELPLLEDFFKFLNKELTLNDDIIIDFNSDKDENMTTGVRMKKHHIKVLKNGRMFIDVLRTLAHEWVHEYQHQKMGLTDSMKKLKIGGWSENHANAVAGILIKKFAKSHKEIEDKLYE
jgi:hypothetical protein